MMAAMRASDAGDSDRGMGAGRQASLTTPMTVTPIFCITVYAMHGGSEPPQTTKMLRLSLSSVIRPALAACPSMTGTVGS